MDNSPAGAPEFPFDQRWWLRREYRREPGERINPVEYGLDVVSDAQAAAFLGLHHYAGAGIPPVRLGVGLMRKTGRSPAQLVGVALFTVPMNQLAVPHWLGVPADQGCELGRLACAPEVLHNGESWFMRRAFNLLKQEKPGIKAVLSYADPIERWSQPADGGAPVRVKAGHFGSIYQSLSARFVGVSSSRTLLIDRAGRSVSPRALSKLRRRERGWEYALRQLAALCDGSVLAAPDPDGDLQAWLDRAIELGLLVRQRHPGNFAYAFALTAAARARLVQAHPEPLPYPKARAKLPGTERLAA